VYRIFISAFAAGCLARKCSFGEEIVGKEPFATVQMEF